MSSLEKGLKGLGNEKDNVLNKGIQRLSKMLKDIYFLRIWFCNIFCVFCRLILWKDGVNKKYWKLIDLLQENKLLVQNESLEGKITVDGTFEKYKARLCVKGFKKNKILMLSIYILVSN